MDLVEVERKLARKAGNNARGVVGLRCNLNLRHYRKTHSTARWIPSNWTQGLSQRVGHYRRKARQRVCFTIANMVRWQSGPMHGIANPENREFKSHPHFQI